MTFEISTLVGKVGKAWKAAHLTECCSTMPSTKATQSSGVIVLALMAREKSSVPCTIQACYNISQFLTIGFLWGSAYKGERDTLLQIPLLSDPIVQIPLVDFLSQCEPYKKVCHC